MRLPRPTAAKLGVAVTAGAVGALVNEVAIWVVKALGLKPGTGGLARLVFGVHLGTLEALAFHFFMGSSWASRWRWPMWCSFETSCVGPVGCAA